MTTIKGTVLLTIETFNKLIDAQIKSVEKFAKREPGWNQERWIIFSPLHGSPCLIEVDPLMIRNPLGRSGYIFVKDFYPKYVRESDGEFIYIGMYKSVTKEKCVLEDLDSDEAAVIETGDLNIHRRLPVWQIAFVDRTEHEDISALVKR